MKETQKMYHILEEDCYIGIGCETVQLHLGESVPLVYPILQDLHAL
jgi:hypothetical protein